MNGKRAREILKKLEKSYRVRLGLAHHYNIPSNHIYGVVNHKQEEKIKKYADIVDALDFAQEAINELEGKGRGK